MTVPHAPARGGSRSTDNDAGASIFEAALKGDVGTVRTLVATMPHLTQTKDEVRAVVCSRIYT